jgi:hypothetical protein
MHCNPFACMDSMLCFWASTYPKPRLEQKRVAGLVLDGNKSVLERKGVKGKCSCEETLA